jgi:hypothetical protein
VSFCHSSQDAPWRASGDARVATVHRSAGLRSPPARGDAALSTCRADIVFCACAARTVTPRSWSRSVASELSDEEVFFSFGLESLYGETGASVLARLGASAAEIGDGPYIVDLADSGPTPTPVPEPGTLLLVLAGLLGIGLSRRQYA